MPDLHSLADRLYYANRRSYSKQEGNVAYLDDTPLKRSMTIPGKQRIVAVIIAIAAIVIGALFVNDTVIANIRETAAAEKAIEEGLARKASIDTIPNMIDLATLSDDEIRQKFADDGYTIYDASDTSSTDNMILYKLADDISIEEAAALFAQGLNGLSAPQAVKFFNGSWYFSTERAGGTSMITRYADFTSGNPAEAVQRAIEKQGYDPSTVSESGVDDSGNTYSMGVIEEDKKAYTWKISALPLSEMYSISKLPEDACYVGIRLTEQ